MARKKMLNFAATKRILDLQDGPTLLVGHSYGGSIIITQHGTDLCLNEIERRGELTFHDGSPLVPYQCDYMVDTILTRPIRRR